jgi:hypothetical protein
MALYLTTRAVYEHSQDSGSFCGRACAQMVISSLIQGPAAGSLPTPAEEAAEIPVTQDELRLREDYSCDDTKQDSWFTHPDELLKLLKTAEEFGGGFPDWRLAVCPDQPTLFTEIIQCLQGGMPAILCVRRGDHWVVIVGVEIDDVTSEVTRMMVLDPLPQNLGEVTHTYVDGCKQEGLTYVEHVEDPQTQFALGGLELALKNTPSPPTLNDYSGKCVAVVYGPSWNRALAKLRQMRVLPVPPYVWRPKAPLNGTVPDASIESMRQALDERARLWEITWLRELLIAPHEHVARIVYDVDKQRDPYSLLSLFAPTLGYGVVGAFRVEDNRPLHFRFTRIQKFGESLKAHPGQPLWWTLNWLPELKSPYFPFAQQVVNNKHRYRRLFDDYMFERDISHGV